MSIQESVASIRPEGESIPISVVALPTAAIVISELLIYLGFTNYALGGHLLTFLALLLAPMRVPEEMDLLRAFMLVPLFRLVNLGIPVIFELTVYWLPLVYAPLVPALYLVSRDQSSIDPRLGIRRALPLILPLGVPIGILLASVEYRILGPSALIPEWSPIQLGTLLAVMLVVGFVEELLFRGILQRTIQARIGRVVGILVASVIFGLMHSGYGSASEVSLAVAIGLLFGLIYDRIDSLALVGITHAILNLFLFGVFPLRGQLIPLPF